MSKKKVIRKMPPPPPPTENPGSATDIAHLFEYVPTADDLIEAQKRCRSYVENGTSGMDSGNERIPSDRRRRSPNRFTPEPHDVNLNSDQKKREQ